MIGYTGILVVIYQYDSYCIENHFIRKLNDNIYHWIPKTIWILKRLILDRYTGELYTKLYNMVLIKFKTNCSLLLVRKSNLIYAKNTHYMNHDDTADKHCRYCYSWINCRILLIKTMPALVHLWVIGWAYSTLFLYMRSIMGYLLHWFFIEGIKLYRLSASLPTLCCIILHTFYFTYITCCAFPLYFNVSICRWISTWWQGYS